MATTTRIRVRSAGKNWNQPGPDLLRTRGNARKTLSNNMGGAHDGWYTRLEGGQWSDRSSKHEVLVRFDHWRSGKDLVIGRKNDGGTIIGKLVTKREVVKLIPTPNCSRLVVLGRSLIEHQFPKVIFAGGYLYRQIDGSTSWSDHAWGDAIDESANPPEPTNDETFDWVTRMAKSNNLDYDYALGSKNGKVVTSGAPDFNVQSSSASTTHLWHVHISFVDHNGNKPPHEGGH